VDPRQIEFPGGSIAVRDVVVAVIYDGFGDDGGVVLSSWLQLLVVVIFGVVEVERAVTDGVGLMGGVSPPARAHPQLPELADLSELSSVENATDQTRLPHFPNLDKR